MYKLVLLFPVCISLLIASSAKAALTTPSTVDRVIMVVDDMTWADENCSQYELNEIGLGRYLMANGLTASRLQDIVHKRSAAGLDRTFFRNLAAYERWRDTHVAQACWIVRRLSDPNARSTVLLRRH